MFFLGGNFVSSLKYKKPLKPFKNL